MEEEPGEMHSDSEDDKALMEKNKKRTVKSRAQIQALEKFYSEHKYPTETMKLQLAESIGLTEKQVSGWFCHRRLKDKRLMNGEIHRIVRQDRSSGVILDRGSGHRQDSCGSTKQGDDRNFDAKEMESGQLTCQEYSAAELTYDRGPYHTENCNRMPDTSSGSSSSLRSMPNSLMEPLDVASSRQLLPKFSTDSKGVKTRTGPSGYLKVKGRIENPAITAVKRQLGKHYREDGPPLSVEFDPPPPGAFESSKQDAVDETYFNGAAVSPDSPDIPKSHRLPEFDKGCEYNPSMGPRYSNMARTSFKASHGSHIPNAQHQCNDFLVREQEQFFVPPKHEQSTPQYIHQKFRNNISLSRNGACYPVRKSKVLPGDVPESDDCGMRYRQGVELMRMDSVSNHQPCVGKVERERKGWLHKYDDMGTRISSRENIENEPHYSSMQSYHHHNSLEKVLPREAPKGVKAYAQRRMEIENRVGFPFKNAAAAPLERMRDEFPHKQQLKRLLIDDKQLGTYRVIRSVADVPSRFTEDDGSADTSFSFD